MPKKTLLVTRRIPEEVESRITRDYVARFNVEERLYSSDELFDISAGADALLITQEDVMDAGCSPVPSSVRVIATLSAGFDHIDLAAAAARGIKVTNTPGVVTDATGDIVMLLLLAARHIVSNVEIARAITAPI
jgi:lactate dehydrogenase-like 2-hydroxyacid dehydrogenase